MWRNSVLLIFLIACNQLWSQQSNHDFKYESAHNLVLNNHLNVDWYGDVYFYRWSTADGTLVYRGDASRRVQPQIIFTEAEIRSSLRRAGYDVQEDWRFYSFQADDKSTVVNFRFDNKRLAFDWRKKSIREVQESPATIGSGRRFSASRYPSWQKFNSDSSAYIYAREHQLYVYKRDSQQEIQLSTDGDLHFSFNSAGNRSVDTVNSSTTAIWAGRYIVSWREDKRLIDDMAVVNNLHQPRPSVRTYKFPMPGDSVVADFRVEIWDTHTMEKKVVDILTEKDQRIVLPGQLVFGRSYLHAPRLGDDPDGVFFLRRNRRNDRVELCRLDFASGQVRVLIDETTSPHINEQLFSVHVLPHNGNILFWSERTGYGQYYRYNSEGVLLNKVGPEGDYVVGGIHFLDTAARAVFLQVYGFSEDNNPYYRQYVRADLESTYGVLLTPEEHHHQITLSGDNRYVVSQYSTIDQPPRYTLRDTSGKLIAQLGEADHSALLATGWMPPEKVKVSAADGKTNLYGLLYKPTDFDPSSRYPVIASVYPGPQEDFVPQGFAIDDNYHQSLADLGYIVVQVPSRGSSPLRGLQFHSYSYGNMRDYPLEDNKLTLEILAKERPYIDLENVGIFGHSGGGFMSATALLTYPEFYKVAVAASGNYDPNIYTQWWGETYHGLSPDGKQGYIPTTMELADRLQGKLLLITGDVDINVHPAQTFRLAEALIKANKYFDMMVLPGKDHGLGDKYYQNLIRNYFLKHLKNNHD